MQARFQCLLTFVIAGLLLAGVSDATRVPNPISDTTIILAHRTIASKRSFADTYAAFETAVPPLNTTFKQLLDAGRPADALVALKALPPLSNFLQPRNFGQLLEVYGITGKKAVQYEIGNPYTASKMARYSLGVALYAPIRVALLEDESGRAKFVYDRPTSLFGQFRDGRIDATAVALDHQLTQLLLFVGGWPSQLPIAALP